MIAHAVGEPICAAEWLNYVPAEVDESGLTSEDPRERRQETGRKIQVSKVFSIRKLPALVGLLCAGAALSPTIAAEETPDFGPTPSTGWLTDRPTGDDFLAPERAFPPLSGPGPVFSIPGRPYVPNGNGNQPTYRVADLTNPILQDWAKEKMKKANDDVLAGKVPYITRERCWAAGVPGFNVYSRVQPYHFYHAKDKIVMVNELNTQIRHVYMNVPHSKDVKPSWYGESVGRWEGDELVVDTIGLNDRTHVDNYRTPHTDKIHVIERYKMIEGGKTLQATITIEDPGTFNMPWTAVQRWRRVEDRPMIENLCEDSNVGFFDYDVVPIPQDNTPDF